MNNCLLQYSCHIGRESLFANTIVTHVATSQFCRLFRARENQNNRNLKAWIVAKILRSFQAKDFIAMVTVQ